MNTSEYFVKGDKGVGEEEEAQRQVVAGSEAPRQDQHGGRLRREGGQRHPRGRRLAASKQSRRRLSGGSVSRPTLSRYPPGQVEQVEVGRKVVPHVAPRHVVQVRLVQERPAVEDVAECRRQRQRRRDAAH